MERDCASVGGVDGSNLLPLCFDHCSEFDPDIDFDKTRFSQLFFAEIQTQTHTIGIPRQILTCQTIQTE